MNLEKIMILEKGKNFFKFKVIPNSNKNEIIGLMDDGTIKLKAKGVPENFKVNNEIIKFLAKEFNISKTQITIVSGLTASHKLIRIDF